VAVINYHFGSKDALYAKVWRNAFEESLRVYPLDDALPAGAAPAARLRALVYSHLHRILDNGRLGYVGQILLQEMSHPTEVIRQVRRDVIGPLQELTRGIIMELLGPQASEQQIGFCEMSVIHQCLPIGFREGKLPPFIVKGKPTNQVIDALADHITGFSLAGIAAVRMEIESGGAREVQCRV
jgi:AcrR family transcriptional regulator